MRFFRGDSVIVGWAREIADEGFLNRESDVVDWLLPEVDIRHLCSESLDDEPDI